MRIVSEIAPRPWKWNYNNELIDGNGDFVLQCAANDTFMMNAVNEHDNLIARAEKAEAEVVSLNKVIDKMAQYINWKDTDNLLCGKINCPIESSDCKTCIKKNFEKEAKNDDMR